MDEHWRVAPAFDSALRGPRVFGLLDREPVSAGQMDAFALRLREALGEHAGR